MSDRFIAHVDGLCRVMYDGVVPKSVDKGDGICPKIGAESFVHKEARVVNKESRARERVDVWMTRVGLTDKFFNKGAKMMSGGNGGDGTSGSTGGGPSGSFDAKCVESINGVDCFADIVIYVVFLVDIHLFKKCDDLPNKGP